jgi:uncharacterized membrane protein YqjE
MFMYDAERSVFDILCDIASNIQGIVRSEFRLVTTEIREDISASQSSVRLLGMGVLSAIFAALFALLAFVYALSQVLPPWVSALLVAFLLTLCAALMVRIGSRRLKKLYTAQRIAAQFKENPNERESRSN